MRLAGSFFFPFFDGGYELCRSRVAAEDGDGRTHMAALLALMVDGGALGWEAYTP